VQKWAQIIDVITPSPDRLEKPPCVHCFDCGGCALQHMRLEAYRAWKVQTVTDRLDRANLKPSTLHPLITTPIGSRRRATFAARRERGRIVIGFNRHHSDHIVDLAECHVVIPAIIDLLPDLRVLLDVLLHDVRAADVSVVMLDGGLDVLVTAAITLDLMMRQAIADFIQNHKIVRLSLRAHERAEPEVILEPGQAVVTIGGVPLAVPPGAFLQPSRAGEEALIDCVTKGVGDAKSVVDLFCGMGTFTHPLARAGKRVAGFDVAVLGAPPGIDNPVFTARNLYRDPVPAMMLARYDAVVFDPPRAGAKAQAPAIVAAGVARVVAVSCNPTTFVNDCAPLVAAGYHFSDLWIIDQFTWSSHVEMVGVFAR
jgi:23S rRNA (uracil1939-C5)-methyltransferase